MNIPQGPDITLLGIYPKNVQSYHKDSHSVMLTEASFVMVRNWKKN